MAYAGLAMSLHAEWQYLQQTVPAVGGQMHPIEEALRAEIFPALFGERVGDDLCSLLRHSVKRVGLGIPNPAEIM
eukprot:3762604-Ditylum_brightwellii.AAC.1